MSFEKKNVLTLTLDLESIPIIEVLFISFIYHISDIKRRVFSNRY